MQITKHNKSKYKINFRTIPLYKINDNQPVTKYVFKTHVSTENILDQTYIELITETIFNPKTR